jgi:catechol 2,3-dioxygenase-like lactoylglutathione lyase family enzyme
MAAANRGAKRPCQSPRLRGEWSNASSFARQQSLLRRTRPIRKPRCASQRRGAARLTCAKQCRCRSVPRVGSGPAGAGHGIAERFYTAVLAPLGLSKVRDLPDAAIGFGKKYPEFWINKREAMGRVAHDGGVHICLRAPDVPAVDAFHAAALKAGGPSDGDPGVRMHYDEAYYAAFIRDPDGNRIEAVRFL